MNTGHASPLKPTNIRLRGASGKRLQIDGKTELQFEVQGWKTSHTVLVGDLTGVDMLLGMNWLTYIGAVIDFHAMKIQVSPDNVLELRTSNNICTHTFGITVPYWRLV